MYKYKNLRYPLTRALSKPVRGLHLGIVASLAAFAAFAASCSSDPSATGSTGDTTMTTTTTSSSTTGGGTGGAGGGSACDPSGDSDCKPTSKESMAAPITVDSIEATVLDTDGAPVPDQLVFACGVDICPPPGTTGADGHVLLNIGSKMLKQPAFKYGDGLLYGKFAAPITDAKTVFQMAYTPKLPETGSQLVAGKEATSNGVTLTLAADTLIEHDVLTYDTCEAQAFRAAQVPADKAPAGLDPALGLALVYAVGPVDTFFCPAAMVTVPNTPKWAAGTAVEFFVHGLSVGQEHATYGEWTKISDGAVSADGMTISTATNGGLPVLSAFGVRQK
jgi:hypothetical protein